MDNCIAALLAVVGRRGRDDQWVVESDVEAAREFMRRRYVYDRIHSMDDFNKLVFVRSLHLYYKKSRNRPPPVRPAPKPEDAVLFRELLSAEADCKSKLTEREQWVVKLREEEKLAYAEIASQIGTTKGNARQIPRRARRSVADCMRKKGFGLDDLLAIR